MGINSKSRRATGDAGSATTVIASGCKFDGEFELVCDTQVDGLLEGKISCNKTLTISPDGQVSGVIRADKIIVNGGIDGVCYANTIHVLSQGRLRGDFYCDDLSIDRGGRLIGTTHERAAQADAESTVVQFAAEADAANAS